MSKAVSRQDWEQRAAALQIQGQAFVAGQYQPALSGETFDCVSPIDGRVLAQDIDRDALNHLGRRIERQRLENVSIRQGELADPKLPENSFDRIFMVHMYHEIAQPYEFLWRMWPALRKGGQVIVVDIDRATDKHGIDPLLLSCEFKAAGYELVTFKDSPELAGYYAQFKAAATRPEPGEIQPCRGERAALGNEAQGARKEKKA